MKMIYIENTCTDPAYNLAFEEYVFTQMRFDEPVLLLWRNAQAVIVGRYQNTLEEIDEQYVKEHGIRVVRRDTGGGAVYHDLGNLNYSFIIPEVDRMKVDFRTFTAPVVKALQAAGIHAEQSGRNDILADGKKFSGNAQHFSRGRLLHHGTLMFDVDMETVAAALRVKPGKFRSKATKSVRSRVTNLKPLLEAASVEGAAAVGRAAVEGAAVGRAAVEGAAAIGHAPIAADQAPVLEAPVDTLGFKQLLLDWFRREYDLREEHLSPAQIEKVRDLQKRKYESASWNFGRSPASEITRGDFFRCGQVVFHFSIREHRVHKLQITGDFFSSRDIAELEQMLEGVQYEREALLQVLSEADLPSYLGDVTAEELVDVIV